MSDKFLKKFLSISFSLFFVCSAQIFAFAPPEENSDSQNPDLQDSNSANSIEDSENEITDSEEIQFAVPDETSLLESGTKIQIRTQKSEIPVFINNNFQGKTPLVIKNLIPGSYILKIGGKKFEIEVSDKHYDKYFF